MKKTLLTMAIAMFGYNSYAQSQITTTGNNVIDTSNPYAADITIGSNASGGIRHDASMMWWSNASASRISNTDDVFYYSVWNTTTPNIALGASVGSSSYFQGNVGLGTVSPLSGGGAAAWLTLNGTATYSGGNIYSIGGTAKGYSYVDGDGLLTQQAVTGQKFVVNTTTTAMSINSSGNVGIGTTSPNYGKLEVNGVIGSDVVGNNAYYINSSGANYGLLINNSPNVFSLGYGTNPATIGTSVVTWNSSGNVGIGTTSIPSAYKLAVNGAAIATSMTVKLYADWPDYVFKSTYHLPLLTTVKAYIDKNKHLPDMPSEQQVKDNGINLGEIVKVQTKKIEELTLYLIDKDKQLAEQQKKNEQQDARIAALETAIAKLTINSSSK